MCTLKFKAWIKLRFEYLIKASDEESCQSEQLDSPLDHDWVWNQLDLINESKQRVKTFIFKQIMFPRKCDATSLDLVAV